MIRYCSWGHWVKLVKLSNDAMLVTFGIWRTGFYFLKGKKGHFVEPAI